MIIEKLLDSKNINLFNIKSVDDTVAQYWLNVLPTEPKEDIVSACYPPMMVLSWRGLSYLRHRCACNVLKTIMLAMGPVSL